MAKKRKTKVEEIIINNPEPNQEPNQEPETEIKHEVSTPAAKLRSLREQPNNEVKSEPEIKHEPKSYKRPLRRL